MQGRHSATTPSFPFLLLLQGGSGSDGGFTIRLTTAMARPVSQAATVANICVNPKNGPR